MEDAPYERNFATCIRKRVLLVTQALEGGYTRNRQAAGLSTLGKELAPDNQNERMYAQMPPPLSFMEFPRASMASLARRRSSTTNREACKQRDQLHHAAICMVTSHSEEEVRDCSLSQIILTLRSWANAPATASWNFPLLSVPVCSRMRPIGGSWPSPEHGGLISA